MKTSIVEHKAEKEKENFFWILADSSGQTEHVVFGRVDPNDGNTIIGILMHSTISGLETQTNGPTYFEERWDRNQFRKFKGELKIVI